MKNNSVFHILCLFSAITLLGCTNHEPSDPPCNAPMKEWPFPSNASRWLFAPIKAGDTLNFRVYRRPDRSMPYSYIKTESFMIKDTMIKKFKTGNIFKTLSDCNKFSLNDYLVADITGPEPLTCLLTNDPNTNLQIQIQNKLFTQYADLFGPQQPWLG